MQPDRIGFGPGVPWVALSKPDCERLARSPETGDKALRLFFAAVWRLNSVGHAEFFTGELAEVLADKHGQPPSDQGVAGAIKRAKDRGLIGSDSMARCLTLPSYRARTTQGGRVCRVHGVRHAWQEQASPSLAA